MKRFKKQILSGLLMFTMLTATTGFITQAEAATHKITKAGNQTNKNEQTKSKASDMVDYGNMKDMTIHTEPIVLTEEWDKVFPLSDEVNHKKVTFTNHF